MKKTISIMILIVVIISLGSCGGLQVTPEMEQGMEAYVAAVRKSAQKQQGSVKVMSRIEDNAIEFKSTESVIDFSFSVADNKVKYSRTDSLNGVVAAVYECDGERVLVKNGDNGELVDKTEENKQFLSPATNPLITLSLFRVDNNYKVKTEYLTDVRYDPTPDEDGNTRVEFTLNDSTVTNVLGYSKVRGIVRSSAGHIRSYYIDEDGCIAKIVVSTVQSILNNGKEGYYSTEMTVECA